MKLVFFLSICLIALTALTYLLHRLCLWLEMKGYLYYRNKKPEKGIMGSTMEELQGILNPGVRHTIEMKRVEGKFELDVSKARDKPKDDNDRFIS